MKKGAPQGSIVSSILANIYYHELDEFVKLLKDKYETPRSSQNNHKSPAYKALESKISQISKTAKQHEPSSLEHQQLAKELKTLQTERLKTAGLKDKKIRLEYVRYGDDWIIGVAGDKKLARTIQEEIRDFTKKILAKKVFPQVEAKIGNRGQETPMKRFNSFFFANVSYISFLY